MRLHRIVWLGLAVEGVGIIFMAVALVNFLFHLPWLFLPFEVAWWVTLSISGLAECKDSQAILFCLLTWNRMYWL